MNLGLTGTNVVSELAGLQLAFNLPFPVLSSTCYIEMNFPSDLLVDTVQLTSYTSNPNILFSTGASFAVKTPTQIGINCSPTASNSNSSSVILLVLNKI